MTKSTIYILVLFFVICQTMESHGVTFVGNDVVGGMHIGGDYYGNNGPGRSSLLPSNYQTWRNGRCVNVISFFGKGVKESFDEPCSSKTPNGDSTLTTNNFVIVGDLKKHDPCFFTDKPSTLVVIRNGGCTLKTYTTVEKITTSTPSTISDDVCKAIKKKMAEELEKNRIYWIKWRRRFNRKMRNDFPPGFPFHKPQPPEPDSESEEKPPPEPYISPYSAIPTNVHAGTFGIPSSSTTTPSSQPTSPSMSLSPPSYNHPTPLSPPITNPPSSWSTSLSPSTVDSLPQVSIPLTPPNLEADEPTTAPTDTDIIGINSPKFQVKSKFQEDNETGECQVNILIIGRGVNDNFLEPCSKEGADIINREDVFVFGHPKKRLICLFSDKWGTLVTIRNKICTLKTFIVRGNGYPIEKKTTVPITKCSAIKHRMIDLLKGKVQGFLLRPSSPPQQPLQVAAPSPPVINNVGTGKVTHGAGGLINGGYSGSGFNSDGAPGANVVSFGDYVHGNVYHGDFHADSHGNRMTGGNNMNSNRMTVTSNRISDAWNGECKRKYEIIGRGINGVFVVPCTSSRGATTYNINNVWIFGDIDRDDFLLFTDTYANLVVFSGGECVRKTYTSGNSAPTTTSLINTECSSYKDKMRKEIAVWTKEHEKRMAEQAKERQERMEQQLKEQEQRAKERLLENERRAQERLKQQQERERERELREKERMQRELERERERQLREKERQDRELERERERQVREKERKQRANERANRGHYDYW